MKQHIRNLGRRLLERLAPTVMASISDLPRLRDQVDGLSGEVEGLRRRNAALEAEIQETRRLHRRVAEITDVVEEALLPATDHNGDRLRHTLDKYAETQ